jgi:bifunctional isochorismate lyase/aryl carrier protein
MAIPRITPYPMPTRTELVAGPARWRPDPARAVLLIHDMQRWFLDFFPAGRSPTADLVDNTARLARRARRTGIPVVYSAQPGRLPRTERGLLYDFWGPGMPADPSSREIIPELAPAPGDRTVTKRRYSALFRTELAALLSDGGRDQLIVCGVFAHIGCLATAVDALSHDVQPFLIADATADFTRDDHLMALRYAARRCAVTMTTADMLDALPPPPSPVDAAGTPAPPAR